MQNWQEDLLKITEGVNCEHEVFSKLCDAARILGFDHCAYGLRLALPLSNPRTIILNDYPLAWRQRYVTAGYLAVDPVVAHGRRSMVPLHWHEDVFVPCRGFWEEARSHGLKYGWSQSCIDVHGVGGMLSLSRCNEDLTVKELQAQEIKMRWLVNVGHLTLSRIYMGRQPERQHPELTGREVEVLKWTADGKTSREVAELLQVTENTVNFHIKNAIAKLRTANKTAAVVRAVMLGLLF